MSANVIYAPEAMMKKRFMRDNVFDGMMKEVRVLSNGTKDRPMPAMVFHLSLTPLANMYETCEKVMNHLEITIEEFRRQGIGEHHVIEIIRAIRYLQAGLIKTHDSLKDDLQSVVDEVEDLKESVSKYERHGSE